ncbi:DUF805 domain-containing protein [Amorphus sp. 3PC139-8]|uniref:DUF805 domain-containing protein n=1 Tax=Amorphus sp. 3PC139-8 TaxID=2735676 RepID=UPI00345CAED0
MTLEQLLLSGSGRIGRGVFWLGVILLAFYSAAAAAVFRVPEGSFCDMNPQAVLGRVYFAALAVMVLLGMVMLLAICAKRLSDMGWPESVAFLPVIAVPVAVVALRLDRLGPCGALTEPRLAVLGGALGLLALAVLLGGLWPPRRDPHDGGEARRDDAGEDGTFRT